MTLLKPEKDKGILNFFNLLILTVLIIIVAVYIYSYNKVNIQVKELTSKYESTMADYIKTLELTETLEASLTSLVNVNNKIKEVFDFSSILHEYTSSESTLLHASLRDGFTIYVDSTNYFDYNSFQIRDDMKPVLDTMYRIIMTIMKSNKKDYIDFIGIAGHTDASGDALYNYFLSLKRSYSAFEYIFRTYPEIMEFGEKIMPMGVSKYRPLSEEMQDEKYNRRVEMKIIFNFQKILEDFYQ